MRSAVAEFFLDGVDGLNEVYRSYPKLIQAEEFLTGQPPGTATGCVGIVHLTGETETRVAIGGEHDGWKMVRYQLALQLNLRSVEARAEDAMDAFDEVVDGAKALLRSDRRLASAIIFEAGEQSLSFDSGEPTVDNSGAVTCWGVLRFEVSQMVQA